MAQTYEVNLINLMEDFNSEDKCRGYLERLRWPDGPKCPRCGKDHVSRIKDRATYDCDTCHFQFSVTSGTIMHDTHLPLWKWFLAIYMMTESQKSVSANQLRRSLKVAPKTAWFLCQRIRTALQTPDGLLAGVVEVDETYVGHRKPRYKGTSKRGRGTSKQLVVGAVERGGGVRTNVARMADRETLRQFILENVADNATAIYTDENPAYGDLNDANTVHETVNHSQDEWVRGDVHTNSIEGSWSLFKRCIVGAYHKVSVKHLDRYLDEFEFRFNNRNNPYIFRDAMKIMVTAKAITYDQLVA